MIDFVEYRTPLNLIEYESAIDLRRSIFLEELRRERTVESDSYDVDAHHIVAVSDGVVIGTLRCYKAKSEDKAMKIGRVCVRSDLRGHGIGKGLMLAAIDWATSTGVPTVYLHAEYKVHSFYERLGFVREGEIFLEAGAPHILMVKDLPCVSVTCR